MTGAILDRFLWAILTHAMCAASTSKKGNELPCLSGGGSHVWFWHELTVRGTAAIPSGYRVTFTVPRSPSACLLVMTPTETFGCQRQGVDSRTATRPLFFRRGGVPRTDSPPVLAVSRVGPVLEPDRFVRVYFLVATPVRRSPGRYVRVGSGNIGERLAAHQADTKILHYRRLGILRVTLLGNQRLGIELYLAETLQPLVGECCPDVVPLAASIPGAA
jgi:hypothetical protein